MRNNLLNATWGNQQQQMEKLLGGNPPTEVSGVLRTLGDLQEVLDRAVLNSGEQNAVGAFNRLYRVITQQVLDRLNEDAFQDPEFLSELDVQFASLYFKALQGHTFKGKRYVVPGCWSKLFNLWDSPRVIAVIGATAGVNAHVNHDLSLALVRTFKKVGREDLELKHADYLEINDIFHKEIPRLTLNLTRDDLYGHLQKTLNGRAQYWLEDRLVDGARDLAWIAAERLWERQGNRYALAGELRRLDQNSAFLADAILSPSTAEFLGVDPKEASSLGVRSGFSARIHGYQQVKQVVERLRYQRLSRFHY